MGGGLLEDLVLQSKYGGSSHHIHIKQSPTSSTTPSEPQQEKTHMSATTASSASETEAENSTNNQPGDDYFYQSDDGRYCFLHPLHQRVLKHAFAEVGQMPDVLDLVVENIEESTMNEVKAKHMRIALHCMLTRRNTGCGCV
jgi:hypothetical protein